MVGLWGMRALGGAGLVVCSCTFDAAGTRGAGDDAQPGVDARPTDADGGAVDAMAGAPDARRAVDAAPPEACPSDDPWIEGPDSCYLLFEPANWITGKINCDLVDAKLVSVTSLAEYEYLRDVYFEGDDFEIWIGLSDILVEGVFVWEDGSPFGAFEAWSGGEPNNSGGVEDCTEFRYLDLQGVDGWNDQECTDERYFLCERPKGSP